MVATPIGNLGDVTLRALETLRSVPFLIAAEDTWVTRRLLDRYEIATRTVSNTCAERAGPRAGAAGATGWRGGPRAGHRCRRLPIVSDPGEGLVAAWAERGGAVVALPGASSVLAAVACSALFGNFAGPSRGSSPAPAASARSASPPSPRTSGERPLRGAHPARGDAARPAAEACGGDRAGAVCRELTKLHEQVLRGSLAESPTLPPDGARFARGEVVIVVDGERHRRTTRQTPSKPPARKSSGWSRPDGLRRGGQARRCHRPAPPPAVPLARPTVHHAPAERHEASRLDIQIIVFGLALIATYSLAAFVPDLVPQAARTGLAQFAARAGGLDHRARAAAHRGTAASPTPGRRCPMAARAGTVFGRDGSGGPPPMPPQAVVELLDGPRAGQQIQGLGAGPQRLAPAARLPPWRRRGGGDRPAAGRHL
ncbi:MAG: hypothetical protein U0838_10715 [Chloroflexota bacterium]